MGEHLRSRYEFDEFSVDEEERVLRRGPEVVPLKPKVFDTLLLLLRYGGHVVAKEEMMRVLWPDSFVEEGSLTQNISSLRKVLEEGGGSRGKYVETIPKRGYRFVAEVRHVRVGVEAADKVPDVAATPEEWPPESSMPQQVATGVAPRVPASARRRGWRFYFLSAAALVFVAGAVALAFRYARGFGSDAVGEPPASVAVLPFKTIGGEGDAELAGLGMADAVALKLGTLQHPTVLPASAVFKYARSMPDARTAGQELGVDAVLDGTVQRAGERVRVTAQLVRVRDGRVLWSGKFDARYGDIFDMQDSISEQVAEAVVPRLTADERERLAKNYTQDTEAYQAYMTGVYFWGKRSREDIVRAIGYFQQAIEHDPRYALAYAGLSDCYNLSLANYYEIVPAEEARQRMEESAHKALEIDDTLAQSHFAMAAVKEMQRDYEGAYAEYNRAIELSPSFAIARVRYSYFLYYSGRLNRALAQMRRAQELDPVSPITNGALCYMLTMARQYDEGLKYCRRAMEIDPSIISGHYNLGQAYLQKGEFDKAIAEFQAMPESQRLDSVQALAYTYAMAGRRGDAEHALAELLRLNEQGPTRARVKPYNIALVYAALGDKNVAFALIEKQTLTPDLIAALKYDPQLDALRADPRFASYLRRHNLGRLLEPAGDE